MLNRRNCLGNVLLLYPKYYHYLVTNTATAGLTKNRSGREGSNPQPLPPACHREQLPIVTQKTCRALEVPRRDGNCETTEACTGRVSDDEANRKIRPQLATLPLTAGSASATAELRIAQQLRRFGKNNPSRFGRVTLCRERRKCVIC